MRPVNEVLGGNKVLGLYFQLPGFYIQRGYGMRNSAPERVSRETMLSSSLAR
jgi:hypothetical protein